VDGDEETEANSEEADEGLEDASQYGLRWTSDDVGKPVFSIF